jgi:hypothetical protein
MRTQLSIRTHREEILARCQAHARARSGGAASAAALDAGLLLLLGDLAEELDEQVPCATATDWAGAAARGGDLFRMGFTACQVVHSYCDIRQATGAIANERGLARDTEEICTLHRCVDAALARAITEHAAAAAAALRHEADHRMELFIHDLRNGLTVALLAFDTLKRCGGDLDSTTGTLLNRGLLRIRAVMEQSISDVRASGSLLHSWVAGSIKAVANAAP